ncbi:two-component sensor histidine kinase, partial [Rhizobium leguminosarum]
GLVFFLDPHGSVATVGGRDRRDFLAWMRDPKGRGFLEQLHVSDRILFLQALDGLRRCEDAQSVDLRLDRPSVSRDQRQFAYLR